MDLERRDKVEILMMKYQEHVNDLRSRTEFDYKLISGYVTLIIFVSAWVAKNPLPTTEVRIGFFVLMAAMAVFVILLLWSNQRRRAVVIDTIRNINDALGFSETGVYLDGVINPPSTGRKHILWMWWQIAIIVLALLAQFVIVFAGRGA